MFRQLIAAFLCLQSVHYAFAIRPLHGWSAVQQQYFVHTSNTTGPFTQEALQWIASHAQIFTVEKWQALNTNPPPHDVFDTITSAANAVKKLNSSVCTIFYYNSVCGFTQYASLAAQFDAKPSLYLQDDQNKTLNIDCAGFSDLHMYDFAQEEAREIWMSECVNATKAGLDGCFIDRAIMVAPSAAKDRDAYALAHLQVQADLQEAITEDRILISNHGYGPPLDPTLSNSINAAMIESGSASNNSITELLTSRANEKICEWHATGHLNDTLAAYLMGAYSGVDKSGRTYGSYFGFGAWDSAAQFDQDWIDGHWDPMLEMPLGEPAGPGVLVGDVWSRSFEHVKVTFDIKTKKGSYHFN